MKKTKEQKLLDALYDNRDESWCEAVDQAIDAGIDMAIKTLEWLKETKDRSQAVEALKETDIYLSRIVPLIDERCGMYEIDGVYAGDPDDIEGISANMISYEALMKIVSEPSRKRSADYYYAFNRENKLFSAVDCTHIGSFLPCEEIFTNVNDCFAWIRRRELLRKERGEI